MSEATKNINAEKIQGNLAINSVSAITLSAVALSPVNYIDFNTGSTIPQNVTGRVFVNNNTQSLAYYSYGNIINTGQQLYTVVTNGTNNLIPKGSAVKVQSSSGGLPSISLAIATHTGNNQVVGLATQDIQSGSTGLVLNQGLLSGVTVSHPVGSILYLSDTTPGALVASTSSLQLPSRVNQVGYTITSGTSDGQIYVSINNERIILDLTDLERNILEGNVISTGVYEYTGMTQGTGQTINVSPVRGWIVYNTYENSLSPDVESIYYTGGTNIPLTYLNSADSTFILINSASTLVQQTTFPTPQERRLNLFLGKVVHLDRSTISSLIQTVDFDVSPMAALRDLWSPLKLVNQGVLVSANGANLSINTSAGSLWGNGIGWVTNQLNPNNVAINAQAPATFQYGTRLGSITGGTAPYTGNTTFIDPNNYDLNGVVTAVGGGALSATNQRIYLFPTGLIRIQYGQQVYSTLAAAVAGSQTEQFVEFSNNRDNGILIGILSVVKNVSTLNSASNAVFNFVSKFGEVLGGTGGLSTTTLQQAYDNSSNPEIITNLSQDGVQFRGGTGSDADKNIIIENNAGTPTAWLNANGSSLFTTITATTKVITTNFQMTSGATNGYVLTSDASGNARWAPPSGSSGATGADTYVTGFTYNNANKLTISQNQGQAPLDVFINTMTGLTVNGNILVNGYVSATTIYNTSGNSFLYNITANTMFVDWIDFNQNATVPTANGRISWDSGTGTLNIGVGDSTTGTIDLQVGQEEIVRVYNAEATTLTKGTVVYVSGSQGNRPAVKRAIATNDGYSVTTLGIVDANITSGAEGYVTTFGIISNLNTTGYSGGTAIWLSPISAGTFTSIKPIAPDHTVLLGYVVRVDNNVGSVFVNISNGWEIDELHDVRISGSTVGDLLVKGSYNGSPVWVNSKTLTGNYLINGNLNITGTTISNVLSATTVYTTSLGVSGNCVTDAYIGNLHGCSPITVHDSIQSIGSSATGITSFAFGNGVSALGDYSHAESSGTTATGLASHAEGIKTTSSGFGSHAEGFDTQASGSNSHSEGQTTQAIGTGSHSEGSNNFSHGNFSHTEGDTINAYGISSHGEGSTNTTLGDYSHVEGLSNYTGVYAYTIDPASTGGVIDLDSSYGDVTTEFSVGGYAIIGSTSIGKFLIFDVDWDGVKTTVKIIGTPSEYGYISPYGIITASGADQRQGGTNSHAEGGNTVTVGISSHAEGTGTVTVGSWSHAEGRSTQSVGFYSHAEGKNTISIGDNSHTEGENSESIGISSHAEGFSTKTIGDYSHSEGYTNYAGSYAYTIDSTSGSDITLNGLYGSSVVGIFTAATNVVLTDGATLTEYLGISTATWDGSNVIVTLTPAPSTSWSYVAIVGNATPYLADIKIGAYSHVEGTNNYTLNAYSHAEGANNTSIGLGSHAEGYNTLSIGDYSHTQGINTKTTGIYSFASGSGSTAQGVTSFIHSTDSIVTGDRSVVLGGQNITGSTDDFVYVSNLNINSTPISNSGATQVLVRNSSTGNVEYREVSTIGGSSSGSTFTQQDELDLALITSFRFLTGN